MKIAAKSGGLAGGGTPGTGGMMFHRNAWHAAALPRELGRELLRRTILGENVLLYRRQDGSPVALIDRCPHRFAPLSRGTLHGDVVECKYHGLRFDGSGRCVLNPHGGVISTSMHVRSHPVAERHGLVWIWMGPPEAASPQTIPDLSYMVAAGARTVHSHIEARYRYDILVDNLLDISHIEYLHVGSFSSGAAESGETKVRLEGDSVIVTRLVFGSPPPPRYRSVLPDLVDLSFTIHWHPGQVIQFEWRATPAGRDWAEGRLLSRFAHIATPATQATTQYFMSVTRHHDIDDAELDEDIARYQVGVVQREDGPMLEAIAAEMDGAELADLHPVLLPTDVGAMQVRRVMTRLLREQAEQSAPGTP